MNYVIAENRLCKPDNSLSTHNHKLYINNNICYAVPLLKYTSFFWIVCIFVYIFIALFNSYIYIIVIFYFIVFLNNRE